MRENERSNDIGEEENEADREGKKRREMHRGS